MNLVKTVATELIKEYKIRHFIGGSQRFGYANGKSDFDMFVLDSNEVVTLLKENSSFLHVTLCSIYNFSRHYRMIIGGSHIDMIVLSEFQYDRLEKEHLMLQDFIAGQGSEKVIKFIKNLKFLYASISGSSIYRTLLFQMKKHEVYPLLVEKYNYK